MTSIQTQFEQQVTTTFNRVFVVRLQRVLGITHLAEQVEGIDTALDDMAHEGDVDSVSSEVDDLRSEFNTLEERFENMECDGVDSGDFQELCETVEGKADSDDVEDLESELEDLQETVTEQAEEIEKLQTLVAQLMRHLGVVVRETDQSYEIISAS